MAYADLTQEQKDSLNAWMILFRPACGELARVMNHADVVNLEYVGITTAILGELQGSDVIPVQGGLTGAESMTKDQVVTIISYFQGILTGYNTAAHRTNLGRACGEGNLIG